VRALAKIRRPDAGIVSRRFEAKRRGVPRNDVQPALTIELLQSTVTALSFAILDDVARTRGASRRSIGVRDNCAEEAV
jgi:hypothetical protein